MEQGIDRVLFTADQIRQRVRELGAQITAEFAGRELTVVSILRGSIIFTADLIRELKLPLELDFIGAQSYGDETSSSGVVNVLKQLDGPVAGRHLLLVDDLLDTGLTLRTVASILKSAGPASLKIAVLLDKPARRTVAITPDYVGFPIPPVFIVGYGMDLAQQYRNLPYIGVPTEAVLARHFRPPAPPAGS